MDRKEILSHLIRARTALKTDEHDRALKAVRDAIKAIDPDREIEMEMRNVLGSSRK